MPTNNRPLDDPNIRAGLKTQQALSVSEGLERGGWIFFNPATGRYTLVVDLDVSRSDCKHGFGAPPRDQPYGSIPVGTWHTHPKNPGQTLTCPQKPPGTQAANGPSPEDKQAVRDSGRPVYVMDNNEVWFISFPRQSIPPSWKHTGSGAACQW